MIRDEHAERLQAFTARVYAKGHQAGDFEELAHGLLIVSPIRPPSVINGIEVPEEARNVPVQHALAHRVEKGGGGPLNVRPGDIVKVWEAHIDPLDPKGNLGAIKADFVKAVMFRQPRVGNGEDTTR
jgi:hypothetical protein